MPDWEPFVRAIYNKSGGIKADKDSEDVIIREINSSLILSGQDMSEDTALAERFITAQLAASNIAGTEYEWICKEINNFNYCTHEILSNYDTIVEKIKKIYPGECVYVGNQLKDLRAGRNIAIITTMMRVLNIDTPDFDTLKWAKNELSLVQESADEKRFFNDILDLMEIGKILPDMAFSITKDNELFFRFSTTYNRWETEKAKTYKKEYLTSKAILGVLHDTGIIKGTSCRHYIRVDLDPRAVREQRRGFIINQDVLDTEIVDAILAKI